MHCQLNPHIRQSSVPQLTSQNPHPHSPLSHNSHLRTHTVLRPTTHISEPTLSPVPQLISQNPHSPLSHISEPTVLCPTAHVSEPTQSSVPQLTSQNPHSPLSHNLCLRTHTHTVLCPTTHISEPTLSSVPQLTSQNRLWSPTMLFESRGSTITVSPTTAQS